MIKLKYKIISLVVFIFIVTASAHAQISFQAGFILGNGIRMLKDNNRNEFGMGYHAGLLTRVGFSDHIAVLPSLTLARKGYYRLESDFIATDGINQRLTYLDFCIPVKYKIGVFTLQAGLQAGYLVDGVFIYHSDYDGRETSYIKSDMNTIDLGYVAGLGLQFKNGFGLDILVNKGFNEIYDEDPAYIADEYFELHYGPEYNGKNLLITLNVFYLFGYQEKEMHR